MLNPFLSPGPLEKSYICEMVEVARLCYERGWCWGTAGNFSVRRDSDILWMSPSGVNKGRLTPHSFTAVNYKTMQSLLPDGSTPSGEMPIHAAIYRQIPEARCVVHCHPQALVTKSASRDEIIFEGYEMAKALGLHSYLDRLVVPVIKNQTPEQMYKFGQEGIIDHAMHVVLLAGHGVYAWARSPFEGLSRIEALEALCEQI